MRFSENSPPIPDELLDQCDKGKVVFFCGAGVSQYPNGSGLDLPSFQDLTLHVSEALSPKDPNTIAALENIRNAASNENLDRRETMPLDEVFLMLNNEFGKETVDNTVADRLKVRNLSKMNPTRHKHIAKISQDDNGIPQIVTTNFDVLFEQAVDLRNVRVDFPPFLPDLSFDVPVSGITYLHGRVDQKTRHIPKDMILENKFILSESDLGAAYLSQGWATNFVRQLVSKHTVVFIGYSAEDPPIRYLLMGMSADSNSGQSNLYAIDSQESAKKIDSWEKKGIRPIFCSNYDVLWDTIEKWADRAKNPEKWRARVIRMTKDDPKILKPYQRGQVLQTLKTYEGLKKFNSVYHFQHPEWINVFDKMFRTKNFFRVYRIQSTSSVLQSLYSTDEDIIGREDDDDTRRPKYMSSIAGDASIVPDDFSSWICSKLNSPAMAWWVAHNKHISASLINSLREALYSRKSFNQKARVTWSLILDCQQTENIRHSHKYQNYLEICVKRYGWNQTSFREFTNFTYPIFEIQNRQRTLPPQEDWTSVKIGDIVNIRVNFRRANYENINIPNHALLNTLIILQSNLLQASLMISQVDQLYEFQTKTAGVYMILNGMDIPTGRRYSPILAQFLKILNRLNKFDQESTRMLILNWNIKDRYFFRKLKLYGLRMNQLFDTEEVFYWISKLETEEFWCENSRSELLQLIRYNWKKFDDEKRKFIIDIIFKESVALDGLLERRNSRLQTALYASYLVESGCKFPAESLEILDSIINSLDGWDPLWPAKVIEGEVADRPDSQVGLEESDTSDDDTHEDEEESKDSFDSLVVTEPSSALRHLIDTVNKDGYDVSKWRALLENWPKDAQAALCRSLLRAISSFPREFIWECKFGLGEFFRDNHSFMIGRAPDRAWEAFDHCINEWCKGEAGRSSNAKAMSISRSSEDRLSIRSHAIAINRVIGKATQGLLMCINDNASEIPADVALRLNFLLATSGEGRNQCAAILGEHVNWLYHLDPDWTSRQIFPLFNLDNETAESAWNGLLYSPGLLEGGVFLALYDKILTLYPWVNKFHWEDDDYKMCAFLVITAETIHSKMHQISFSQKIKRCIREMNESSMVSSIYWLQDIGRKTENGWTNHVIPFIENTWPRNVVISKSALVWSWIMLLADTGEAFPDVYCAVKRFLASLDDDSGILRHFVIGRYGEDPLASRFPLEMLDFVDTVVPSRCDFIVFDLDRVLKAIVDANGTVRSDPKYTRLLEIANRMPPLLSADDFDDDIE